MSASGTRKRSVTLSGHQTSVSMEAAFWDALSAIAARRGRSVRALVEEIDGARGAANLSSAIRVYVLEQVMKGAASPNVHHSS